MTKRVIEQDLIPVIYHILLKPECFNSEVINLSKYEI